MEIKGILPISIYLKTLSYDELLELYTLIGMEEHDEYEETETS